MTEANNHDHTEDEGIVLPNGYGPIDPASPDEVPSMEGESLNLSDAEADEQVDGPAGAASALTDEDKAKLADQQLPEEATTVFAIVLTRDGRWIGTSRMDLATIVTFDREASFDDFIIGCNTVAADAAQIRTLNAIAGLLNGSSQNTAAMVVQALQQQAAHMQEQMKANAILKGVQGKGGLRGGLD